MDELRVWNVALSKEQIRHMMNQEIEDNKKVLEDKYGEVNIELSDGSIKPVEDGKN